MMLDRMRSGAQLFAWFFLLWTSLWSSFTQAVAAPLAVGWSDKSYGPDGPWHAVQVDIGSDDQSIALYPGSTWASTIFLESYCSNSSTSSICYANTAGLFDSATSSTWDNTTIEYTPDGSGWSDLAFGVSDAVPINALARRATDTINMDGIEVPLVDLVGVEQAYQTYPGGQIYPLEVGLLSLSATNINQTFDGYNATIVTSWAYESGRTPSYSYGMHIGSAALGISGSLYLGGFDNNRALGDISAQECDGATFPIYLQDLSIGVESGGSPWNYTSQTGLLAEGNSSIHAFKVYADPADPYIYLPQSSCDALAAQLPVTYQAKYGLYFWNTSDPQYSKIVTSPSYVGFNFYQNGQNNQNITIKVPFALLNLTLDAPLVTEPTSYFPCMGTDGDYALGRAFLQAAFMGWNWNNNIGYWFLAQAPGPDLITSVSLTVIEPDTTKLNGSSSSWADTWSTYWTVLPTNTSTTNDNSTVSSGNSAGLSTGAKAGIGAGSAVGGLLLIFGAAWSIVAYRRRRRAVGTNAPVATLERDPAPYGEFYSKDKAQSSANSNLAPPLSEMSSTVDPVLYELPAAASTPR